jgi:branched-chain amino acid transport system substrate-binding protein
LPQSAISIIFIIILTVSVFGCAPATPIVVVIPKTPTVAAVIPTAIQTIPPTETPLLVPTQIAFDPKATIKIAVHVPLSAGNSRSGTDIVRAAEFAAEQLAAPLTELGYKLELVSYDDQSNTEVAVANAKQIVADPEILCSVDHHDTGVMIRTSETYHLNGLAFVSPSSTATNITDRSYPEVNRIVGRDDGQGIAGAQFAHDQGISRVYIVFAHTNHSEKNADYFLREAIRLGVTVVGKWDTDLKENFEWVLRRVLAANPDLVYFATNYDQAGPFFREARAAGYTGAFLSSDEANRSALVELAGPSLVEGGGTYFTETVALATYYSDATQFVNDFDARHNSLPREYAVQGYDATGICIKAIEEASKAKGGELPTRKEVAKAIRALVDYQGITGIYNFNKKGDLIPATYYVFKVVSPDPANWNQNTIVATYNVDPPR